MDAKIGSLVMFLGGFCAHLLWLISFNGERNYQLDSFAFTWLSLSITDTRLWTNSDSFTITIVCKCKYIQCTNLLYAEHKRQ